MRRRYALVLLLAALLGGLAWAQNQTVTILALGKHYQVPCESIDGRTYVQICGWRFKEILLAYHTVATFDPAAQTLTLTEGDQLVTWQASDRRMVGHDASGQPQMVDMVVQDGEAWVPLVALPSLIPCRIGGSPEVEIDPLITDIRLVPDRSEWALHVDSSAAVTMHTMVLKQPDRFVVDIPGAGLDSQHFGTTRAIIHPDLGQIRFGQFSSNPNVVRIVIPLQNDLEVEPLPESTDEHLVMALRRGDVRSVAQDFATQKITDVQAVQSGAGLTLDLKVTGPVQFTWHRLRPPDNRIFVDVPGTVLVGSHQKIPSNDGWTNDVTISQFQLTPTPIVRIVFGMARPAAFDIKTIGDAHDDVRLSVRNEEVGMTQDTLSGVKVTALPSKGGTVVIDPGHGGSDSGSVNPRTGLAEKTVTLAIAQRLAALMHDAGWNVFLTRDRDRDVSYAGSSNVEELQARCKIANDVKADLFISIHCNASVSSASYGSSAHWFKSCDLPLARSMLTSLVRNCGCTSRGCQFNHFYVLRHTNMPAVLVETAFITNGREERLLESDRYRSQQAQAIFQGATTWMARYGEVRSRGTLARAHRYRTAARF